MNVVYMDSGTTNTRAYLIRDGAAVAADRAAVGTRDSAIAGNNAVLLRGLKELYDRLLAAGGLTDAEIDEIWMSGMVTNGFGIVDVEHMSLPLDAAKAARESCTYREDAFFRRDLHLVRGAKTTAPGQAVTMEMLEHVGNVRGEEIELLGLMADEPQTDAFLAVMPGSHTHVCYVRGGQLVDILSCFTGELNAAIGAQTILSGELARGDVPMQREHVLRGYDYLQRYGLVRALYIVHASKVFAACSDEARTQMLSGILAGGVAELVARKVAGDWRDAKKAVIIGRQGYIAAYAMLLDRSLGIPVEQRADAHGIDFALAGLLEILRVR